jgi:hypothetical protein
MNAIVPKELLTATLGGLSLLVVSGGADGQVLTQQADGTYAPEAAAGGSPGGSSGQVQWNSSGSFAGATALVYATTVTHVVVTAQGATIVPLCVKGAASQTGNLLEARNSSNTLGASIGSDLRFSDSGSSASDSERFGFGAISSGGSTAVGRNANGSNGFCTVLGQSAFGFSFCTSIGRVAGTTGTSGGVPSTHSFTRVICIGDGTDFYAPTASNQLMVCGEYTEAFFGQRIFDTAPTASIRFQGGGASGTNIAGTSVVWAAGRSTGSATPATLTVQTTTVGSSGTTIQTLRDAIKVDGNVTASETPLLLLDIDKGTLQRVSIGASDSGGTGFKVLRVPN